MRGRGSQGVFLIRQSIDLLSKLRSLYSENRYGNTLFVEEYLQGQEITITVMPEGNYILHGQREKICTPWVLPAVKRFNHKNGIAPYSGIVAVKENSTVLLPEELVKDDIQEIIEYCIKSAELIRIKAPIRIDCRADQNGKYFVFDVNLKPNMTGPSRPHRIGQDSLTLMAARKIGWNYFDLLRNMLDQSWNNN